MANKQSKLYRLTLSEDATHKRVRVFRFSNVQAILWTAIGLLVLFGVFFAILALTPLKNIVPGYPNAHFKRDAIANAIKIDSLENEMLRWTLYAENLSRVLSGEETLQGQDSIISNTAHHLENITREEMARRDSVLRGTVAREEKYGVGSDKNRALPIEGKHFFTPLKGTVSVGFDLVLHPGVDIVAPAKSVVSAVLDGTVISAGWTDDAGYSVVIQHADNIISCYKHNAQILKRAGEKVTAGAPVAFVGNTGNSSLTGGDHLYFELWYNGEPVDPVKYCKF